MKTNINPVVVGLMLVATVFCSSANSMAADPSELIDLRKSYLVEQNSAANEDQRQEVINDYIQDLTSLVISMRGMRRDIESVNAVRQEIRKAQAELAEGPASKGASPQVSKTQSSKPAPKPVDPQTTKQEARKSAPEPVAEAPDPKPAPKPTVAPPVPKPAVASPAPKPVAAPVTKPAVIIPVPPPKPTPKVVADKPVSAPKPEPAPKALTAKPEPSPVPAPKPVIAKPAPKPAPKTAPEVVATRPAPKPVAAKPASAPKPKSAKPAATKRDPKIHANSVQGMASAGDFSKNNVYTFDLTELGAVTTVKYWITGRFGIDSNGKVWLVTPDGKRENIGSWHEGASSDISTDVTSYEDLVPVSADVSKLVNKSGTYKIEFEWSNGSGPLYIYRVEIIS